MNCPSCGYQIDHDFGVITCQHCQAVLFVDLDGNVQVSDPTNHENSSAFADPSVDNFAELPMSDLPVLENFPEPIPVAPSIPKPPTPPVMPSPLAKNFQPKVSTSTTPSVAATSDPWAPAASAHQSLKVSDLAAEISNFANETEPTGPLSYELLISGIDSSEIRAKVFEALSDRRFRWEARVLISQISKGQLLILKLNPAKAMVLVRRLQELPVTLRWNQKSL